MAHPWTCHCHLTVTLEQPNEGTTPQWPLPPPIFTPCAHPNDTPRAPFVGLQMLLHNLCLAFGGDAHEPDIERDGNEIFRTTSESERESKCSAEREDE